MVPTHRVQNQFKHSVSPVVHPQQSSMTKTCRKSIEAMRYLLDLPPMETRYKVEQVKANLNVMQNPKNPIHYAVKEEKGCTLARIKSWMGQAEQSIQYVCGLTELKQERLGKTSNTEFKPYYETLLSKNLGSHCREWPAGKTYAET